MATPIITADRLGKAYRLGVKFDRSATFYDALSNVLKAPLRQWKARADDVAAEPDAFWAIRDISFDVQQGEVVGLIGHNGAGKSTLLKVLSRITEPTEGRAVLRGRVASLLEVGTGFHPELSGRENIYLNGAILGMRRAEIDSKFDEIVEFAEVSKFLDTPVKRYSSGMYVRLAFAVAAHLEPEILIVDEVLAVGDASFQRKCLGKMGDVVRQGRTVLFVSHNMDAVMTLCTSVLMVKSGRISERMEPAEGVKKYLAAAAAKDASDIPLAKRPRYQKSSRPFVFRDLKVYDENAQPNLCHAGGPCTFEVLMEDIQDVPGDLTISIALFNERGQRAVMFHSQIHNQFTFPGERQVKLLCHVPAMMISPGPYYIELVFADGFQILERMDRADRLDVLFADVLGTGRLPNQNQCAAIVPCTFRHAG